MQLTGRTFITIRGQRQRSKEGSTLRPSLVSREGQTADTGVAGYTESTSIPGVDFVIQHGGDISIKEMLAMTDETLLFDTDSGKSFVLVNAWCTGAIELSKNEMSVKFQSHDCRES